MLVLGAVWKLSDERADKGLLILNGTLAEINAPRPVKII